MHRITKRSLLTIEKKETIYLRASAQVCTDVWTKNEKLIRVNYLMVWMNGTQLDITLKPVQQLLEVFYSIGPTIYGY